MREPLVVRLTAAAVARADGLKRAVRTKVGSTSLEVEAAFAFKNDERAFARHLLDRLTHL